MVGAKCWDLIAEGYLILNTGRNTKVGHHTLDGKNCGDVDSSVGSSIRTSFLPWGSPRGVYLYGWLGGLVIMFERPP
jgi:hypothetical protein